MRPKYTMSLEPSPTSAQGGWSVCRWISVLVVAAAVPLLRTTPSDAAPRSDASVSERAVHSRGSGVVDKVLVSFGGMFPRDRSSPNSTRVNWTTTSRA